MKYGILLHTETGNLGDDIQSYAAAKLLPHVDYVLDREHLDTFASEDNEPVAVPMSAWWFWQKWNWPPADCIVPKLTSMHMNNYNIFRKGTPVFDEWLQGLGGDYLRAYGPIGCRDQTTLDFFRERNFDCYFSGCVTLTLPKQKKTEDAGSYVVLADLNPKMAKRAKELLAPTGLRIVETSHECHYKSHPMPLEDRFAEVERVLTLYQNARCVITRRLHVSLPCLAMETPVLAVLDLTTEGNSTRWNPYSNWLHYVTKEDFLSGNFSFDFLNPPTNKPDYLPVRNRLIQEITDFVAETEACNRTTEELKKTSYTRQEVRNWQYDLMKWTLERWLSQSRKLLAQRDKFRKEAAKLQKENAKQTAAAERLSKEAAQQKREAEKYKQQAELLKEQLAELEKSAAQEKNQSPKLLRTIKRRLLK